VQFGVFLKAGGTAAHRHFRQNIGNVNSFAPSAIFTTDDLATALASV